MKELILLTALLPYFVATPPRALMNLDAPHFGSAWLVESIQVLWGYLDQGLRFQWQKRERGRGIWADPHLEFIKISFAAHAPPENSRKFLVIVTRIPR